MSEIRIKVIVHRSPRRIVVKLCEDVTARAATMDFLTYGLPLSPDRG
jgi:hypothetical protein